MTNNNITNRNLELDINKNTNITNIINIEKNTCKFIIYNKVRNIITSKLGLQNLALEKKKIIVKKLVNNLHIQEESQLFSLPIQTKKEIESNIPLDLSNLKAKLQNYEETKFSQKSINYVKAFAANTNQSLTK